MFAYLNHRKFSDLPLKWKLLLIPLIFPKMEKKSQLMLKQQSKTTKNSTLILTDFTCNREK